jgi:uncharacterized ferredoxin-like protein
LSIKNLFALCLVLATNAATSLRDINNSSSIDAPTFVDGSDTVVFAADGTCPVNTATGTEEQCNSFKEKQDKVTKDMAASMAKMKADMATAFGSTRKLDSKDVTLVDTILPTVRNLATGTVSSSTFVRSPLSLSLSVLR